MMKGLRWVLVVGLGLTAACVAGLGTKASAVVETAPAEVMVRVAAVGTAPEHRGLVVHGVTRSVRRARLGLVEGGRLVRRPVNIGQTVDAGDVLAAVDPAPFRHQSQAAHAQVAQLQARSTALNADRRRLEGMALGRSVSGTELDRIVAESDALQASIDAARAQAAESDRRASEAVLRAPYPGVVMAVHAEPGETLAPGQPVVELAGDQRLEVEVQVPEAAWAGLSLDAAADVWLPALGLHAEGHVTQIATAARPEGLFPVVVAIDAEGLAAGLTTEVRLQLPLQADATVPLSAIVDPIGRAPAVLRIVDGHAQRVSIEASHLLAEGVAIRGDLTPGDEVVIAGHGRLLEGDAVLVLR